ncbi:hypothetical protein AB9F35_05740 [Rhizobium leguminosarum]|uniref:hypothetical protein n=1 Tax=Rhizobium leguminosarum TaxID=384 RepID=UPI003F965BCB
MNARFRRVGLFVDWNNQLRECPKDLLEDPVERCRFAINRVGKITTKILCNYESSTVFRVRVRLYHGWTSGITQTENRRAFSRVAELLNPDDIFPSPRVVALSEVEFGDRLIDALPIRENPGLRIHLPNTLRRQRGGSDPVEKMVDTALASDLLSWARSESNSIALVFSGDDDMVPPVFVAEAWMKPFGGTLYLIRSGSRADSRFLNLEGLLR